MNGGLNLEQVEVNFWLLHQKAMLQKCSPNLTKELIGKI
jgi:hypothetical protein